MGVQSGNVTQIKVIGNESLDEALRAGRVGVGGEEGRKQANGTA